MMQLIDTTGNLYSPAKAREIAAAMQAGDPDWKYVVVDDPKGTGYSFINILDETGVVLGKV